MSYFFPFGNAEAISVTSISQSFSAATASFILNSVVVPTASFATSTTNVPPNGTTGASILEEACTDTPAAGNTGPTGPSGPLGTDVTSCPPGTKECPGLFTSLSLFVNPNRASGSQFSIVCIETAGYILATIGCPNYLPTSSGYTLPTIPQP